MRALVIGGSGQIGGWLLHHLSDRGHEAIGTFAEHPYPGLIQLDAADREASAALVSRATTRRRLLSGRVHLGRWLRARPGPRPSREPGATPPPRPRRGGRRSPVPLLLDRLRLRRPPRSRPRGLADEPAQRVRPFEARSRASPRLGTRRAVNSRCGRPGSSVPSVKARTSPISSSAPWVPARNSPALRIRDRAPATDPTWPWRRSNWPSARRLGIDPRRRPRGDEPGRIRPGPRRRIRARPRTDRPAYHGRTRTGGRPPTSGWLEDRPARSPHPGPDASPV